MKTVTVYIIRNIGKEQNLDRWPAYVASIGFVGTIDEEAYVMNLFIDSKISLERRDLCMTKNS